MPRPSILLTVAIGLVLAAGSWVGFRSARTTPFSAEKPVPAGKATSNERGNRMEIPAKPQTEPSLTAPNERAETQVGMTEKEQEAYREELRHRENLREQKFQQDYRNSDGERQNEVAQAHIDLLRKEAAEGRAAEKAFISFASSPEGQEIKRLEEESAKLNRKEELAIANAKALGLTDEQLRNPAKAAAQLREKARQIERRSSEMVSTSESASARDSAMSKIVVGMKKAQVEVLLGRPTVSSENSWYYSAGGWIRFRGGAVSSIEAY
ncbi:MAG: hypothetical protein ABIZ04_21895 [Opitutus sp.]